jgi:hypothetical protein
MIEKAPSTKRFAARHPSDVAHFHGGREPVISENLWNEIFACWEAKIARLAEHSEQAERR